MEKYLLYVSLIVFWLYKYLSNHSGKKYKNIIW